MKAVIRLKKEFSIERILSLVDQQQIEEYIGQQDAYEGLMGVDYDFLNLLDVELKHQGKIKVEKKVVKTDILTLGVRELLTICRDEGLISLFEYLSTAKDGSHKSHSYYGLKLLASRPNKFFLGPKSTHFHCKTTAKKIQEEYGIYRQSISDERSYYAEDYMNQSDEEFIDDSSDFEDYSDEDDQDEKEEDSPVPVKPSKIQQKQEKENKMMNQESDKPVPIQQRKKKMQLESESEMDQQSSSVKPLKKGQNSKLPQTPQASKPSKPSKKSEDERILSIIGTMSTRKFLDCFTYRQIFEYLLEFRQERLLSIIDPIDIESAVFTHRDQYRKNMYQPLSGGRKLRKLKMFLKTLRFEELIEQFRQSGLQEIVETEQVEKMTPYDHVRLTKFLHNLNPEKYIIEGKFEAFADSRINSVFEEAYMNDQEGENEEEDEDDYDSSNMIVNDSAPIESEEDELDRAEASLRKRRK